LLELAMKVHHLLFIVWFIVFAFWIARQFANANKKFDDQSRD
jgi:flagellar biogenesis protein FliO